MIIKFKKEQTRTGKTWSMTRTDHGKLLGYSALYNSLLLMIIDHFLEEYILGWIKEMRRWIKMGVNNDRINEYR